MAGADIHYVVDVEPVTVLAQLDREALDLFSVGVYVARKGA